MQMALEFTLMSVFGGVRASIRVFATRKKFSELEQIFNQN